MDTYSKVTRPVITKFDKFIKIKIKKGKITSIIQPAVLAQMMSMSYLECKIDPANLAS